MKRSMSIFLSAVLLLSMVLGCVTVNAAATPQVVCQDAYATPGEQATVNVMIENNPGIAYLELTPVYSAELTNMKATNGALLSQFTASKQLVWAAGDGDDKDANGNVATNGLLATLTFDVAESVPYGQYSVDFIFRNAINNSEQNFTFTVVSATVTVGPVLPTALDEFTYTDDGNGNLIITGFVGTDTSIIIADTYEVGGVKYTVTEIGPEAFLEAEIVSFVANAGLKVIDEAAFYDCADLSSVTLNKGLETIGAEAFYNCVSLLSVTVPNADTELGEAALGLYKSGRKEYVVDGFEMFGLAGSTAEAYAEEYEIPFTVIEIEEEEEIEFAFAGASITLQSDLTVNFKVNKALFEEYGYTNPVVECVLNGKVTTLDEYTVQDDRYVFSFNNIAPNQINDDIAVTLTAELDGKTETVTKEYSVAAYCYGMLQETTDAELRTLLVDLLNYGAAAQTYTGYNTAALANADLTATQKAWGTTTAPAMESVLNTAYKTVATPAATWKAAGLVLKDSVSLRLKFAAESIDGLSVKIEAAGKTWVIPASEFVAAGNGQYYVYFTGLHAGQMSETVEMTVCNGDTAVSNTALYSIESYAAEQQDSTVPGLADLVEAMMKYGNAAYAYAN